jgi:hypothetical protein
MRLRLDPLDFREAYRHETPAGPDGLLSTRHVLSRHFKPLVQDAIQAASDMGSNGTATYRPFDEGTYKAIFPPPKALLRSLLEGGTPRTILEQHGIDPELLRLHVIGEAEGTLADININCDTLRLAIGDIQIAVPSLADDFKYLYKITVADVMVTDAVGRLVFVEKLADERGVKYRHPARNNLSQQEKNDNRRAWVQCLIDGNHLYHESQEKAG